MVQMDPQSEWILLRRVYAFLKSRNLKAAAYALEKEARLNFDYRRLHTLFLAGKWRRIDKYVSAFMRGKEGTPDASGTLFPIRLQRLVRVLKRGGQGHSIWALRYHFCHVAPLLPDHPDRDAARAEVERAMRAAGEGIARLFFYQAYPDDAEHRRGCFVDFLRYADENKYLYRCTTDPLNLNLRFMSRTTSLSTRRYTRRRRSKTHATPAAAGSPSQQVAATA